MAAYPKFGHTALSLAFLELAINTEFVAAIYRHALKKNVLAIR